MPRKSAVSLPPTSLQVLTGLQRGAIPRAEINPGVTTKLYHLGLAREVSRPSPFKTVKGLVLHVEITESGLAYLAAMSPAKD